MSAYDPKRKLMALNADPDMAESRRVWRVQESCISSSDERRQPQKVVECADLAGAACPEAEKALTIESHDRPICVLHLLGKPGRL